ncbi:hypothetical protein ACQEVX_15690 [Streptomyces syringium]
MEPVPKLAGFGQLRPHSHHWQPVPMAELRLDLSSCLVEAVKRLP